MVLVRSHTNTPKPIFNACWKQFGNSNICFLHFSMQYTIPQSSFHFFHFLLLLDFPHIAVLRWFF